MAPMTRSQNNEEGGNVPTQPSATPDPPASPEGEQQQGAATPMADTPLSSSPAGATNTDLPSPAGAQENQPPPPPHLTPTDLAQDILPQIAPVTEQTLGPVREQQRLFTDQQARDQLDWYKRRAIDIELEVTRLAKILSRYDYEDSTMQQLAIYQHLTGIRNATLDPRVEGSALEPPLSPNQSQPPTANLTASGSQQPPQRMLQPSQVIRPRDINTELQDNRINTCAIRPPPVRGASLAGGTQATQFMQFMSALRNAGGDYIQSTPFDMGMGDSKVTPNDNKHSAGWPGKWPADNHDRFSIKHHFSQWLHEVCKWARTATANPEQTLSHAINNIMQHQDQEAIKAHMLGTPATVSRVDALYDAVMTVAHGHHDEPLHPPYADMLPLVVSATIRPEESILDFYARFLHLVSLLFNAVDYPDSNLDANQLKACFISAVSSRPLRESPLLHEIPHPRKQYQSYDLWNLAWINQQHSMSPPEQALQRTIWQPPRQPQAVQAFNAVSQPKMTKRPSPDPSTRPEKRQNVAQQQPPPMVHPMRNIYGYQEKPATPTPTRPPGQLSASNAIPLGGSNPSTTPQRKGVQEFLDPNISPYRTLPSELQKAIANWRITVFGDNKKLSIAALQEVPEAIAAAAEVGRLATTNQQHCALCWCCKKWGHLTTSPLCPFKRT